MLPRPEVTPLTEPYWSGLAAGELRFQHCRDCGNAWLPARDECPRCLSSSHDWQVASGAGRIISWVVYRQAVHEAFVERIPYNVAIVELDEGPRLITNVDAREEELAIELPVRLRIDEDDGLHLPRFTLAGGRWSR